MNNKKSDSMTSIYPIGAVVAFAGNALEGNTAWLECDGSAYSKSDYDILYSVIGSLYGETGDEFKVPDYRGKFLRGADVGSTVGTFEEYATAVPHNHFHAVFVNIPSSTMTAGAGTGSNCAAKSGSKTIDTCTSGGDGDTRPVNVYIKRYIRAR